MADDKKKDDKKPGNHKITILQSDMTEEMQEDIKVLAGAAFDKFSVYKDIATHMKAGFDAKYPPADNKATSGVYHCVVGSNFAVSVTHETHFACYLQCDNVKILLYKSKDSPFD